MTIMSLDPAGVRRCRAQLVGRPLAASESVFVGLRQSRRRISIRHILGVRECRRHSDLEISAELSPASRRTFHHASFRSGDGRIFPRPVTASFSPLSIFVALVASLNGWIICWGATDWFGALGAFAWLPWAWWGAERALDPQRTKWRFLWPAPFVYLLVTGGFPYTVLMLLLLIAWLSLEVCSCRNSKRSSQIWPMLLGVVLGFGLSAPAWLALLDLVQGSARESQPSSTLAMDRALAGAARIYPSGLDGELDRFLLASNAAYGHRTRLVAWLLLRR